MKVLEYVRISIEILHGYQITHFEFEIRLSEYYFYKYIFYKKLQYDILSYAEDVRDIVSYISNI